MKTNTLLTGLLLGTSLTMHAQSTVQVGVKTGLTMAVLDGQINQNTSFKTGIHLGGMLRWRPTERVALQPELVFSQQGSENSFRAGPATLESKTKLTYLNVPVLLKVYLGNVVNIHAGPQFGLRLAAREVGQTGYYTGSNGTGYRTEDIDASANYGSDVAACLGLGADLKNGLVLAVRANYGLTDIDENEQTKFLRSGGYNIGGLHNRVVEFSVGYLFGGK